MSVNRRIQDPLDNIDFSQIEIIYPITSPKSAIIVRLVQIEQGRAVRGLHIASDNTQLSPLGIRPGGGDVCPKPRLKDRRGCLYAVSKHPATMLKRHGGMMEVDMMNDNAQISAFFGRLRKHSPDEEATYLRIHYDHEAKKIVEGCLAEYRENGSEDEITFWFEVLSIINKKEH